MPEISVNETTINNVSNRLSQSTENFSSHAFSEELSSFPGVPPSMHDDFTHSYDNALNMLASSIDRDAITLKQIYELLSLADSQSANAISGG